MSDIRNFNGVNDETVNQDMNPENNNDQNVNPEKPENLIDFCKRKWQDPTVRAGVIGLSVFIAGNILYGKGKKAGQKACMTKLKKQFDSFSRSMDKKKLSSSPILLEAVNYGIDSGREKAYGEIVTLLANTTGEGRNALESTIEKAVETALGQDFIIEECMEYLGSVIDNNLTEEIKAAAARKAYEELKNNDALKDVVYEASSKASKRILENGDLVEGIVKRSASAAAMEYLDSKKFHKELREEVSSQFKELIDDDVTRKVIKPMVTKTVEEVLDELS